MFHAGLVFPSSLFLLQLLTVPLTDLRPESAARDVAELPVRAGLKGPLAEREEEGLVGVDVYPDEPGGPERTEPLVEGLSVAPRFWGPMVVGKTDGSRVLATLLKALMH